MLGAPGEVTEKQLRELRIQIDPKVVAEMKAEAEARAEAAKG
jgi:hypothetical protein